MHREKYNQDTCSDNKSQSCAPGMTSSQITTRRENWSYLSGCWPLASIGLILFEAIIYYFACTSWQLFIYLFKLTYLFCVYLFGTQSPLCCCRALQWHLLGDRWFLKTHSVDTLTYKTSLLLFHLLHSMQLWRAKGMHSGRAETRHVEVWQNIKDSPEERRKLIWQESEQHGRGLDCMCCLRQKRDIL